MRVTARLLAGAVGASVVSAQTSNITDACSALWESAPQNLANLTVYIAEHVEAGVIVNDTAQGGFNPTPAIGAAAHCRFGGNITTSSNSSVRFEVWLPAADVWNGDFLHVGNGGDNGFIQYNTMVVPLTKYNFTVASTNTGHDGTSGDGSFALNNPESQIDFGHRAVHLSTVYSKKITELYYGKKPGLNYWYGCSSGGKQGLKEVTMYPEDYDAALVGAPAWYWSHLNGWTYYVNAIVNKPNSTGFLAPSVWPAVHTEVLRQCDTLDGVADGVITEPGQCFLDYSKFNCDSASESSNSTSCLSAAQVTTLERIFTNWTDSSGDLLFPAFNIGAEYGFGGTINGVPYGPAPNYFLYQVLNRTDLVTPVDFPNLTINGVPPTEEQLIQLVREADKTNPGMTTVDTNVKPFFDRGGKILLYGGAADVLIPSNSTNLYYERVQKRYGNISNSMLFYDIPGMGHCQGGAGAFNFGQANQASDALNSTLQSAVFDVKHDALLALIDWREKGNKPEVLIGASYGATNNRSAGPTFTRKLCPYPLVGRYQGGDQDDESSYECRL